MQGKAAEHGQRPRLRRLINPALAEAQVHGGMSMAIGYGLE